MAASGDADQVIQLPGSLNTSSGSDSEIRPAGITIKASPTTAGASTPVLSKQASNAVLLSNSRPSTAVGGQRDSTAVQLGPELRSSVVEGTNLELQRLVLPSEEAHHSGFLKGIPADYFHLFLGHEAPPWFKWLIISFLVFNLAAYFVLPSELLGWAVLSEAVACLGFSLQAHPLVSAGLIATEAVALGFTKPQFVLEECEENIEVIFLLIFNVAAVHHMTGLLEFLGTKAFLRIQCGRFTKMALSVSVMCFAAIASAWLDALTVCAVILNICGGMKRSYDQDFQYRNEEAKTRQQAAKNRQMRARFAKKRAAAEAAGGGRRGSGAGAAAAQKKPHRSRVYDLAMQDMEKSELDGFLRNIMMHALAGTVMGGVCTSIGQPQNVLFAQALEWNFVQYVKGMVHISGPVFLTGIITCVFLESGCFKWAGWGHEMPKKLRLLLEDRQKRNPPTRDTKFEYVVSVIALTWLVGGIVSHVASLFLIGLVAVIIMLALGGRASEEHIIEGFKDQMPFIGLLMVFFAVVSTVKHQEIFAPITDAVVAMEGAGQRVSFFFACGALSSVSDNVFVATLFIGEVKRAFYDGKLTSADKEKLLIALNVGTNVPCMLTPNGQSASLFVLTSKLAKEVGLTYVTMTKLAFPYGVLLTLTAFYTSCFL